MVEKIVHEVMLENGQKLVVTAEDIDDILVTALEGGINYWCSEVNVVGRYLGEYASEQISRDGELWFFDIEDDSYYGMTLEKFLNGIELWQKEYPGCCLIQKGDDVGIDVGNIDAHRADMIVQFALFDGVVYA